MENTCGLNFQKNVHTLTAAFVTACLGWHWQLVASVAQQQKVMSITTRMDFYERIDPIFTEEYLLGTKPEDQAPRPPLREGRGRE
jgi:hypothetical protein